MLSDSIVELLHTLGVWLTDARCPHYFIHNCNLFDHPDNCYCEIASRVMSETQASLTDWFINHYILKCARLCPGNVWQFSDDVADMTGLPEAVSAVVKHRLSMRRHTARTAFMTTQYSIMTFFNYSLTVRSYLYYMRNLVNVDKHLPVYFIAVICLHVAYKTTRDSLKDELLDVLATTCLQSNDARRCMNARHSSVLSLSQAAKLMKVVANNSRSTVQLIEIELSKAYLYRALKLQDNDSIYCLANVYLAVLYYNTGHYQTAIDHCTLVTRSQDHSQCSSHVVQGELLPKIDDDIDTVLGLSVFYQYVRTAALNQLQQTQHVSVFTTELFAHYLHIRCLLVMKCRQLTQTSSTDEVQRYLKCFYDLRLMYAIDVLVLRLMNRTDDRRHATYSGQSVSGISHQLDTSELVELLQQSAIEHLTVFRQLEAQEFSSVGAIVTTDFDALYAYKCGEYQDCLQLSTHNVLTLVGVEGIAYVEGVSRVFAYPEFIQLMDDDIVSLTGLTLIVNPSFSEDYHLSVFQLNLSLYLMAQCQMKLNQPVTSLALTLDCVEVAHRYLDERCILDHLLLKLTARLIALYIS